MLWAGRSDAFRDLDDGLRRAARSDSNVLLVGASGTGKGAAARRLVELGPRAGNAVVVADLAAVAPTLLEAHLFGHEAGAFTDARRARPGAFRTAEGGTLILDDIDVLPLESQPKLLRVLEERVVEPLGSEVPVPIDVRIVATTNRDLRALTERGGFRADLYYRLAVVTLHVPPLRARAGDVRVLAEALVEAVARRVGVPARPLTSAALDHLEEHPWPGNVRELENALERVLVLAADDGPIQAFEFAFLDEAVVGAADDLARRALAAGVAVDELTHAMLQCAFEEQRGNLSAAARQVGLTRRAFEYRLARDREPEEA
ncbi:MAG: sigma 54-interacting transcriptional regulator [Planctomycetota bacterium]